MATTNRRRKRPAPPPDSNGRSPAAAPDPAVTDLVQDDRVHRTVYTDPAIFAAEMRRIYGNAWVYVAHESELQEPNAFRTRTLGGRPIIVTRGHDDNFHVLLNRCLHRGAVVCRVERGRAKRFVCPYHGWAYDNSGTLSGVPWPTGYADDFDLKSHTLAQPQVASYRGLLFATLNPDPPELEEYLGRARPLMDAWLDRFPADRLVARSGAHRMDVHANWKLVTDNATDGYHPAFSHRSLLQMAQRLGDPKDMTYFADNPDDGAMYSCALGNGHAFSDQRPMYGGPGAYWAQQRPQPGREAYEALIRERYDEAEATRLLDLAIGAQMNLTVFPNLLFIGNQLQVIEPVAADRTILTWYATTSPELPDEINTMRVRSQEDFPSFGEPDDLANFGECQRGLSSVPEFEWVLMNRGLGIDGRAQEDEDGVVTVPITDEAPMRGFYQHWKTLMTA